LTVGSKRTVSYDFIWSKASKFMKMNKKNKHESFSEELLSEFQKIQT
jgi:hypothetical protein